jgi:hypothetical protein
MRKPINNILRPFLIWSKFTHEQALTMVDRVIKKLLMPEQEAHVEQNQDYKKIFWSNNEQSR